MHAVALFLLFSLTASMSRKGISSSPKGVTINMDSQDKGQPAADSFSPDLTSSDGSADVISADLNSSTVELPAQSSSTIQETDTFPQFSNLNKRKAWRAQDISKLRSKSAASSAMNSNSASYSQTTPSSSSTSSDAGSATTRQTSNTKISQAPSESSSYTTSMPSDSQQTISSQSNASYSPTSSRVITSSTRGPSYTIPRQTDTVEYPQGETMILQPSITYGSSPSQSEVISNITPGSNSFINGDIMLSSRNERKYQFGGGYSAPFGYTQAFPSSSAFYHGFGGDGSYIQTIGGGPGFVQTFPSGAGYIQDFPNSAGFIQAMPHTIRYIRRIRRFPSTFQQPSTVISSYTLPRVVYSNGFSRVRPSIINSSGMGGGFVTSQKRIIRRTIIPQKTIVTSRIERVGVKGRVIESSIGSSTAIGSNLYSNTNKSKAAASSMSASAKPDFDAAIQKRNKIKLGK